MKYHNRLLVLIFLLTPTILRAQDEKAASKIEMVDARVRVTDPDGNPIADALVYCTGLRMKQEPGSHWGWPQDIELLKLKTNEEGIVTLPYPKQLGKEMDVGQITWTVEHSEFVSFREDRAVEDNPAEIQLVRGYKIAASAIDAVTREPIKTDLYGIVPDGSGAWKLFDNGMIVSPTLNPRQVSFRLIKIVDNQPIAFSDMLVANPEGKSRVVIKDALMKPSVKINGRIGEDVPRPIVNGTVSLAILVGDRQSQNRWNWYDTTTIAADGTFEFPHVPAREVVQLLAVCDGWVPQNPPDDLVRSYFPEMRVIDPNRSYFTPFRIEDESLEVELKLNPGRTIKAKVVDDQDQPVSGVDVAVWPNQVLLNDGSQLLGAGFSMAQRLASPQAQSTRPDNRYVSRTDESGVATIVGVPKDYSLGIIVTSKDYEMIDGGNNGMDFKMADQPITEVTLRVKKIK